MAYSETKLSGELLVGVEDVDARVTVTQPLLIGLAALDHGVFHDLFEGLGFKRVLFHLRETSFELDLLALTGLVLDVIAGDDGVEVLRLEREPCVLRVSFESRVLRAGFGWCARARPRKAGAW